MGESFGYTNVDDLKTQDGNARVQELRGNPTSIAETVKGLEDAVSGLQERVAALEFIARKDHPDLVQDWDDDPPEDDA